MIDFIQRVCASLILAGVIVTGACGAVLVAVGDEEFRLIQADKQPDQQENIMDFGEQLGAHLDSNLRVVKVSVPNPAVLAKCDYCDQLKENVKDGVNGGEIVFVQTDDGPWPTIELPDAPVNPKTNDKLWWQGALTKGQIEAILREYPPQGQKPGVHVGKIKGKSAYDALLGCLRNDVGDKGIYAEFGHSRLFIPKDCTAKFGMVKDNLIVTFPGTAKPMVSKLGIYVTVDSIEASQTQRLLTLRLSGFPSITVEVVD